MSLGPALDRLETARRVLGHACTLTTERIAELVSSPEWTEPPQILADYGNALLDQLAELQDPQRPDPVLPAVDITGGTVWHITCTGRSRLTVQDARGVTGWRLDLDRPGSDPLDGDSGRDVALLLLADTVSGIRPPHLGERGIVRAVAELTAAGAGDEHIAYWLDAAAGRLHGDTADLAACWTIIGVLRIPALYCRDGLLQRAWATRHPDDPPPQLDPDLAGTFRLYNGDDPLAVRRPLDPAGHAAATAGHEPLAEWERDLLPGQPA